MAGNSDGQAGDAGSALECDGGKLRGCKVMEAPERIIPSLDVADQPAPVAMLSGVTQRYGKVLALDHVDLTIPAHQMIGLIGPDGVGKSTLLGLIAGVRRIQDGQVNVLGGNMGDRRFRESMLARVAYMPQGLGRNLYPTLSIFENVDF